MDDLIQLLGDLPPALVYLAVAALVAAETGVLAGMVVPTLSTLLFTGFLARTGVVDVRILLAVAFGAAVLGDSLGYAEGRRYGGRLRESRLGRRVGPARWEKSDAALARHGGRAVSAGRFTAGIRTITPRLAGSAGLPYGTFLRWNVPAVLGWACLGVGAGYAAGRSYDVVAGYFGRASLAVVALAAVLVALVLAGRWLGRHPEPVRAVGRRLTGLSATRWAVGQYASAVDRLVRRFGPRAATAVDLGAALAAMALAAVLLSEVARGTVHLSGIELLDRPLTGWVQEHRDPRLHVAGLFLLSFLRSSVVGIVVTVVAVRTVRLRLRPGRRPGALLYLLGTVGAFLPLVVLAVVVDATRPTGGDAIFPAQNAVVTAGFGLLAWFAGWGRSWSRRVTAWTVAVAGIVLVTAARLYVGWTVPSEAVATVLLGLFWDVVLVVAWRTHERIEAAGGGAPGGAASGAVEPRPDHHGPSGPVVPSPTGVVAVSRR